MTNASDDSRLSQTDGTVKLPPRRREQRWIGRALCFAACVLAVNALIGERGLSETLRARREFRQAVSDLSRIQYENAALAGTIDRLRHDADTIEDVARAELGLIRPGEILVVVKPTSTQAPAGFTPSSAVVSSIQPGIQPATARR